MKIKRILTFILSLSLILTGIVPTAFAEEEPAKESDNELTVIMDDDPGSVEKELTEPADEIVSESIAEELSEPETPAEEVVEEDIPMEAEEVPEEIAPAEQLEEKPSEEEVPVEEKPGEETELPAEEPVPEVEEPVSEQTEPPVEEPVEEPPVEEEPVKPEEEPVQEDEPVQETPEEEPVIEEEPEEEQLAEEEPASDPEEALEEEAEEEPENLPPHQAGDFVAVSADTSVFLDMDKSAFSNRVSSDLFVGMFINKAVVQIEEVQQDADGHYWYKVRYLYGDSFANGSIKWTAYGSVFVIADETADTDADACTMTDFAFTRDQLNQRQMSGGRRLLKSFSPSAMNGFSLKNISVSLGNFYEWQSGLNGSSGKDSDYPQIAKSSAHGTIYATPHYLEGFEVYCLEHTQDGPGEGSGRNQAPKGPYVLVDMDTFSNTSTGDGVTGVRFSEKTMHALAWVLRHTYPFMVLDRNDSDNYTWSRVAGQFAMREVIKQLEGSQYVRSYWDMDNFYSFSGGAPSVYLTYARWLAANGIARAGITGKITFSNASLTVSGSSYIGTVTVTTDADLIRIPKSVGSLTGNSAGSDSSYYYAKSGDTIKVTSTERKFTVTMESVSSDSEEAHFLVGIPEVSIQKIMVPTYGSPYPLKEGSVTFELKRGEIEVTKKSSDGILLKNTVFELLNSSGTVIATATTNTSGVAKFPDLEPGSYTVREKTAPQGYNLDTRSSENVTVVAGAVSKCTFTNQRITGKVRIVKTDSQTKKPLAGATFTVTRLSGPESDNASDIGKVVATITTNAQGIAETGVLPWGQYKIVETGVPDGYLDSGYSVTVWIK